MIAGHDRTTQMETSHSNNQLPVPMANANANGIENGLKALNTNSGQFANARHARGERKKERSSDTISPSSRRPVVALCVIEGGASTRSSPARLRVYSCSCVVFSCFERVAARNRLLFND